MKALLCKLGFLKAENKAKTTGPDVPIAIAPEKATFAGHPLRIRQKVDLEKLLKKIFQADKNNIDPTINEEVFNLLWDHCAVQNENEKRDYARSVDAAIEVRKVLCTRSPDNYVEFEIRKELLDGTWSATLYDLEKKEFAAVTDHATEALARLGAAIKAYKQCEDDANADNEAYIAEMGGIYCLPEDK